MISKLTIEFKYAKGINNMFAHQKLKIIYIMGAGHSGSTLLDITLGNHPEIQNCGELKTNFFKNYLNNNLCTCGVNSNECTFLNEVIDIWKSNINTNIDSYLSLQQKFESSHFLFNRNTNTEDYKKYLDQTLCLLQSISRVSGNHILVDSSKNPVRALNLSSIPGIDVVIVHLIRDGRGVVWSHMKNGRSNFFDPMVRSKDWAITNFMSEIVYHKINSKKIQIKYEDFMSDSREIMNSLGNLVNLNFIDIGNDINNSGIKVTGHILAGNGMRHKSDKITLKPDYKWKKNLKTTDKLQYMLISWPFAIKYHYL